MGGKLINPGVKNPADLKIGSGESRGFPISKRKLKEKREQKHTLVQWKGLISSLQVNKSPGRIKRYTGGGAAVKNPLKVEGKGNTF